MRKFARATGVNGNDYRYFEVTDSLLDIIRTQHLLGIEDCIVDAPIFEKDVLPTNYILVSANTSSIYSSTGPINFLYFAKNKQLIARFRK